MKGEGKLMKMTKFLVKVNSVGARYCYVRHFDGTLIQTTSDRKQALLMGKFTAEDAVKSIQNSRCSPQLVPVQVSV